MRKLFTYGSLMCDDIMVHVAGPCRTIGSARLTDYRCVAVKNEEYPAIFNNGGYITHGVLYDQISDDGFARLDEFEGEMYERRVVAVTLEDGSTVETYTYVFKPEFAHLLTDENWQFEAFLKKGKAAFIEKYVGFTRI
ncbi:MAG: gamma-glutamylcyclotransferase [Deltaproteobacteria bacterium]|nr:gamma-glutamylcyclotransferase [Deltaproteobacteria bacterium]